MRKKVILAALLCALAAGAALAELGGLEALLGPYSEEARAGALQAAAREENRLTQAERELFAVAYAQGYDAALGALDGPDVTYVLNKHTLKMHRPDCESVADIAEKNRLDYTGSRELPIRMGYAPCKRCRP